MTDSSTSEAQIRSNSSLDEQTSTNVETIVVLHSKVQRSAAKEHVKYLQRKGHSAVQKQCNDVKSFKDMDISPYSRLDMLVDLSMFNILMKKDSLHEDAGHKYKEIDESEKELYSINMFGSDFGEFFKLIPLNIRKEASHANDFPKMFPTTNNTGMGGGSANGSTCIGSAEAKVIFIKNVNERKEHYDVKKTDNKIELTHKDDVTSGGNENSGEPKVDIRIEVSKEKQETLLLQIREQQHKLENVNGVKNVETGLGSIIITFTLENGHVVTEEWIKGILLIIFDDILKRYVSEGEIFRVDVHRRVQYTYDLLNDAKMHENCITKTEHLKQIDELREKKERLQQTDETGCSKDSSSPLDMASKGHDPTQPTKDQAKQAYKIREAASNTEQSQNYITDQTVPKVSAEEPEQSRGDNDSSTVMYDRHQDDQCWGQGAQDRADGNSQDPQCAHTESLIVEEHTLHHAKQEQSQGSSKPLFEEEDYLRHARDCSRSGSFLSSSQTSVFSQPMCGICSAADTSLLCSRSKEFWRGVESSKCCEKKWKHFSDRLKEVFPNEPALQQGRVMHLLKTLLGVNDSTDVVKFDKFVQLVRLFGPFRSEEDGQGCAILHQLEYLVNNSTSKDQRNKKKSWFAGFMSREEAIAKLDGKSNGTFLVRISETEEESFALDLVMGNGDIEHFLLKGNPEKAVDSNPFRLHLRVNVGGVERTFDNLPDLVKHYQTEEELFCTDEPDNGTMCTKVCIDLPFNHIIYGYSE